MLDHTDIDFINKQFGNKNMESKDYRYTISFINGSPGLVVKGDDPADAQTMINDILPVFKSFKEAVEKAQPKPQNQPEGQKDVNCNDCGSVMTYREGENKNGKPYKAYFCPKAVKGDFDNHKAIWL